MSLNQTIVVKMTRKSQSAPTEAFVIQEANTDTTLTQEDSQEGWTDLI